VLFVKKFIWRTLLCFFIQLLFSSIMKNTMFSALLRCSLLTVVTSSCLSAKSVLNSNSAAVISSRLPPLEMTVETSTLNKIDGTLPEDFMPLFKNEIQHNITEPTDTVTFGYAHLQLMQAQVKRTGRALQVVQMATLLLPSILGIPLGTYQTNLVAEVQITDAQGEVLGRYVGKGHARVRVAMYYGYSQQDAPLLSDALALREALAQIRPQIDSAATRLRPLLLRVGPVDNPARSNRQSEVITDGVAQKQR
jgi:hypothetical protein